MIETLSDIVESIADKIGVYGAHDEENDEVCNTKPCRVCWASNLTERIWAAIQVEQDLERGRKRPLTPTARRNDG